MNQNISLGLSFTDLTNEVAAGTGELGPTYTIWDDQVPQPFTAQRCRPETEKKYFRGSFQFSIVTILKISPLWKPEI